MYDELVKRLRNRRICIQQSGSLDDFPLLKEAADAIEELSAYKKIALDEHNRAAKKAWEHHWISVKERLPELRQNVLVSDGKGSGEGWLDRYDWHDPNREDVVYTSPQPRDFWCIPGCEVDEEHVTHWMPLPQPPVKSVNQSRLYLKGE